MKRSNIIKLLLLAVSVCVAVACNDSSNESSSGGKTEDPATEKEADFKISAESVTSNSATIVVEPKSDEVYYTWDMVDTETFCKTYEDDAALIAEHRNYLNTQLETYRAEVDESGSLLDLLSLGKDSQRITGLKPSTQYTVFAFGMDADGNATTAPVKFTFETNAFEVADTCSFEIAFSDIEQLRFTFTVTPSNNSTRYYIGIADGDILNESTPEEIADGFIKQAEVAEVNWAASDALYTGAVTLDTLNNLEIYDLSPDTAYSVVVFGVSNLGERTTAVFHKEVTTAAVPNSDMTFSFEVTETSIEGAIIKITPSTDETYMAGCIKREDFDQYTDKRAFMEYAVEAGNLELYSGEQLLDKTSRLITDTDYVCFAFGYIGGITTDIFYTEFHTEAPKTESAALVEVSEVYGKANSTCDVAVYVDLKPNEYAEHWYAGAFKSENGIASSFGQQISDASIINTITTNENYAYWDSDYAACRGTFGQEYTFFVIARDKDGNLGPLVKKTFVASEDLLK